MNIKEVLAYGLVFLFVVSLLTACGGNVSNTPSNEQTATPPTDDTGDGCKILDYYNADGGFSALGLALDEENSEKVLTVTAGETLIAGTSKYIVTAESIVLCFYTQPSLAEVIEWWTDYCEGLKNIGELAADN